MSDDETSQDEWKQQDVEKTMDGLSLREWMTNELSKPPSKKRPEYSTLQRLRGLIDRCIEKDTHAIDDFLFLASLNHQEMNSHFFRYATQDRTIRLFHLCDATFHRFIEIEMYIIEKSEIKWRLEVDVCRMITAGNTKNWHLVDSETRIQKLNRILVHGKQVQNVPSSVVSVYYHARDWVGFFRLLELYNSRVPIEKFQGIGMRKFREKLAHLQEVISFFVAISHLDKLITSYC